MVEWKKIGEISSNVFAGGTPSTKRDDFYDGDIPWIRSGEIDFNVIRCAERNISELGYKNSSAKKIKPNSVVMAMTGATVAKSAVVAIETSANQSVCAIEPKQDVANYKFIYYCLANDYFKIKASAQGALTSLNLAMIKNIELPIPSIQEQERIVAILDTFTKSIDNLKQQIELRRKQYTHYRDQLLDLEGKPGIEMKTLGEICTKTSNIKWKLISSDDVYKYIDLSSVNLDTHQIEVTLEIGKSNAPSRAQQIVNAGDIILGTTRPTLRRYCIIPNEYNHQICSTGYCVYRPNTKLVINSWLFHNIGKTNFWSYCEKKQQGAGYPCLSNSDAFAYSIPLPSLQEQTRIVSILDKFEASISNLEDQLNLRQKQYEYYRNKLLTFE